MAYQNRNICKSFSIALGSGVTMLSGAQECSEITVSPRVSGASFFDYRNPSQSFLVPVNEQFTFRGLTNTSDISATGTGCTLYYRTAFFSNTPDM